VLREGPIPAALHGLIEYLAGIVFIAAPFVLGFDSEEAWALSIVLGVVIIALAATTSGSTSLVNQVPIGVHVALDYAFVVFAVATPFIFGFYEETAPTVFFIAVGVIHLLVTIGTRFRAPREIERARREGAREERRRQH
jgi:hypothetical protein